MKYDITSIVNFYKGAIIMSVKKVKSASKIFVSDQTKIKKIIAQTMTEIANIVGSTLGPSGRVCLIESEYFGIPNKNTKDGVTVFKALGAEDPYKELIITQLRDAAIRTASEAGDGTTTATILATAFTKNLLSFCDMDKKFSPQKVVRILNQLKKEIMLPYIKESAVHVNAENLDLLYKVAKISANGDDEMASAVIEAFELTGISANSHVTIQELSGPGGYRVDLIEGFPIGMGYEESVGSRFHNAFINDQANLRCVMDSPLFILFDGQVNDIIQFQDLFEKLGSAYASGDADYKNVVLVSHGFSESVITSLAINFANPSTINIIPLVTPMDQVKDSRFNFLQDLSAFTGAKIFGMHNSIRDAQPNDFGKNMEKFECYRFRSTVVGQPDPMDIEVRADVLKKQLENPESRYAEIALKERLGKLTSGIAKLQIFAGSAGELRELSDRVEDAVCAVRAAISHGALPGGCRTLTNLALIMNAYEGPENVRRVAQQVVAVSLLEPLFKLLDNAGYNDDEVKDVVTRLTSDPSLVYNLEEQQFGTAEELGLFDAAKAVEQAIENAISIASVMGVMGGLIAFPRDHQLEREEASNEMQFRRDIDNAESYTNEANLRG